MDMEVATARQSAPALRMSTDAPTGASVRTQVALLGPPTVSVGGTPVDLRASRQRRLLCILAVSARADLGAGADEIVDALYEGQAPPRPKRALATEIWRLRRLLGTEAVVTDATGYRLNLAGTDLDLAEFEDLVAAGSAELRDGSPTRAQLTLSHALKLWRGEPLVDLRDHPSGQAAIARLEELRLGAVVDHAEALASTGQYTEAVSSLDEVTAAVPALERAWALLIDCYLAAGNPTLATRALGAARRVLAEQGLDLGPELRAASDRLEATSRPVAAQPAARATAHAQQPGTRLLGRDHELARLASVLEPAIGERRSLAAVITGEAGIGKSALVGAAAEAAATASTGDVVVHRIYCDSRLELPYAPLAPLVPDVAGDATDPAQLRDTVIAHLESAALDTDGMLLVVEDAHCCTAATLEVLCRILARRSSAPLAVLVTVREPAAIPAPVAAWLAELRTRSAVVLELGGLDESATAALLGSSVGDPDTVHQLTGGNPLYIGEVRELAVRDADGANASASLTGAIDAHLGGLEPDVLDVLRLASVIGVRFDVRVLIAAAHGTEPARVMDALDSASAARLLRTGSDGQFGARFVHGLIQDHLYRQLRIERRAQAHLAAGNALERIAVGGEQPFDLIAHHFARAWPACSAATAAQHLQTAGEHAATQLDFVTASDYYRRALDLLAVGGAVDDDDLTRRLLGLRGESAMAAGDIAGARSSFASLRELAGGRTQSGDRLWADLGELRSYGAQLAHPATLDRLADDLADTVGDSGDAPPAHLAADSIAALYRHRPAQARDLLDAAVAADPVASAEARLAVWEQQDIAGQVQTAHRLVADPAIDPARAWLRIWVSELATGQRSFDEAPEALGGLRPATSRGVWEFTMWRIVVAQSTGQLAMAERLIDGAQARVQHSPSAAETAGMAANLRGQRTWQAILRGDPTGIVDAARTNPANWAVRHPMMREQQAYRLTLDGDVRQAERMIDEILDDLLGTDRTTGDLLARLSVLTDVAIRSGHRRGIAGCARLLAPHAGEHMLFYFVHYWGPVSHGLGRLALASGDLDEAVRWLSEAIAAERQVGAPTLQAQSRRHLAVALWHRNRGDDRVEAVREHDRAASDAARMGLWAGAALLWPPPAVTG